MDKTSFRRFQEDSLSRYDSFSRRELPSRVHRRLELQLLANSSVLEETLKSQLGDMIRECQKELYEEYMRSNNSITTSHEDIS